MRRNHTGRVPGYRVEHRCRTTGPKTVVELQLHVSEGTQRKCVIHSKFWLTSPQDNPHKFLPMRTRPYRNIRILNVIRDLFFSGGNSSFAIRFRSDFPIHQGNDGVVSREVPIPMVALVATAVSVNYLVSVFN